MALQIRRGPTADRMSFTPVVGELIWDTSTNSLYIGNGITVGGLPAGTLVTEDVQDIASTMLTSGTHQNITFTYDDTLGRINSTFNLSTFNGTITADGFIGSHYANDSTLLLNALTGSINLNGTVKGNVVPDANEAYDLGSASYRFRDLYLSGSSIKLGSATITSIGSSVNLPAGSTVGGITLGSGVESGMNYNINLIGDDSTLIVNARTKSISAASLSIVNPVSLPAGSTLNGTAFGFSIATEDSTITAINNGSTLQIRGDEGIQTRYVAGALYVSSEISTINASLRSDSSAAYPLFTGAAGSRSYLGVDYGLRYFADVNTMEIGRIDTNFVTNPAAALTLFSELDDGSANAHLVSIGNNNNDGRLQIITNTYSSTTPLLLVRQSHSTADARDFRFARTRGTSTTPLVINDADDIADLTFAGYDGANFQTRASITAIVDGAVSAGVVPTRLNFQTGSSANGIAVSIGPDRNTSFNGAITLVSYADTPARDTAITAPARGMMIFNIGLVKFQGYTGAAWVDLN